MISQCEAKAYGYQYLKYLPRRYFGECWQPNILVPIDFNFKLFNSVINFWVEINDNKNRMVTNS